MASSRRPTGWGLGENGYPKMVGGIGASWDMIWWNLKLEYSDPTTISTASSVGGFSGFQTGEPSMWGEVSDMFVSPDSRGLIIWSSCWRLDGQPRE